MVRRPIGISAAHCQHLHEFTFSYLSYIKLQHSQEIKAFGFLTKFTLHLPFLKRFFCCHNEESLCVNKRLFLQASRRYKANSLLNTCQCTETLQSEASPRVLRLQRAHVEGWALILFGWDAPLLHCLFPHQMQKTEASKARNLAHVRSCFQ